MAEATERELEIIEQVRSGASSPSQLASRLGISQSGASQALQKLASKGRLVKRKGGRTVQYELLDENPNTELYFLFQAHNALSQVWAFVMSTKMSPRDLQRARRAREVLEEFLVRKKRRT